MYAVAHYTVYVALHTGMSYMYVSVKAALLYVSVCHYLYVGCACPCKCYSIPVCHTGESGLYTDIHVAYVIPVCHTGISYWYVMPVFRASMLKTAVY